MAQVGNDRSCPKGADNRYMAKGVLQQDIRKREENCAGSCSKKTSGNHLPHVDGAQAILQENCNGCPASLIAFEGSQND